MSVPNIYPKSRSSAHGDILFSHSDRVNRTTAFEASETKDVLFYIPRMLCPLAVEVEVFSEDNRMILTVTCEYEDSESEKDVFRGSLDALSVGLYFLRLKIISFDAVYYGHGRSRCLIFDTEIRSADIQISVSDFGDQPLPKVYGGMIYHIFVDRFCKSGRSSYRGDAVLIDDWENGKVEFPEYRGGPLKNNTFFGGTLDGIREKLPYLSSLGVTVLYLSPIFESPSNHKYDTADYEKIDDMFGGEEAFSDLLSACREYGIGVILDGVFNHTGADSRYFNRYGNYRELGAYQSKDSPYFSWYDFQEHPGKYTCWWDIPILPRIHPDVLSCRRYFTGEDGIIARYARQGILGFRLDVVDELSDGFVSDIKGALRKENPDAFLLGEVWEDASNKVAYGKRKRYYLGEELDGVMNYPLRVGLISYILQGTTEELYYALTDIYDHAPRRIRDAEMNFLGTHDTERILTVFADHDVSGLSNADLSVLRCNDKERKIAVKRLLAAFTILGTLPGIPSVYYGDEAGMEGYHDPFNRMPYPWGREDESIQKRVMQIGKLRKCSSVYKNGDFHLLRLDPDVLIFARTNDSECYITVFNRSDPKLTVTIDGDAKDLLNVKNCSQISLSPLNTKVFKIRKNQIFSVEKSK